MWAAAVGRQKLKSREAERRDTNARILFPPSIRIFSSLSVRLFGPPVATRKREGGGLGDDDECVSATRKIRSEAEKREGILLLVYLSSLPPFKGKF